MINTLHIGLETPVIEYLKLDLELAVSAENVVHLGPTVNCDIFKPISGSDSLPPCPPRTGIEAHITEESTNYHKVLRTLYKTMNLLRMNADSASTLLDTIRL
jgi:hypothetical protein